MLEGLEALYGNVEGFVTGLTVVQDKVEVAEWRELGSAFAEDFVVYHLLNLYWEA